MKHEIVEKNVGLLAVLILVAISFGGLAEVVPLFFQKDTTEPVEGLRPLSALELEGRDIYRREGCVGCHSQMIRPFRAETERYGHYNVAGEQVYEHNFLWGYKRTGPDLARVGGRYSDDWHRAHMYNPRDVVPESIWMAKRHRARCVCCVSWAFPTPMKISPTPPPKYAASRKSPRWWPIYNS